MTEYVKRAAGGFYIIDEPERGSKLWTVRRAVHQVLDPKTDHPYPESEPWETYARDLLEERDRGDRWRKEYEGTFSTSPTCAADLTEEGLRETLEMIRYSWRNPWP